MKEEEYRVTEIKKKEKELFGEIFNPIQRIRSKGLSVLLASQNLEWVSRWPILMASNRFEPNGMANV